MRSFDILHGDELLNVIDALGSIKYKDGRDTAFGQAKAVKNNLEIDNSDPGMQELTDFMPRRS